MGQQDMKEELGSEPLLPGSLQVNFRGTDRLCTLPHLSPPLDMSAPSTAAERSARSVRKLFGALLRTGRRWQVSENRRDRSLFDAIPRVTRQRYSLLRTGLSVPQIKQYGEEGVRELNALKNLVDDVHLKKVRLPALDPRLHTRLLHPSVRYPLS